MCDKIKRRSFIQLGLGAAASPIWLPKQRVFAADGEPEFMLHIHLGSWCGLSSGMVQPQKKGEWPSGAHFKGKSDGSVNPNMNKHFGIGNFVFHDYSRPLAEHYDQLMMATISSVSLAHPDAVSYQQTGNLPNAPGAGWLAAFADITKGASDKKLLVTNVQGSAKPNSYTKNQVTMSSNSLTEFNAASKDGGAVPRLGDSGEISKKFWDLYQARFASKDLKSLQRDTSDTEKSNIKYTLDTLQNGFDGYTTGDADYKSLEAAMSSAKLAGILGDLTEGTQNILRKGSLLSDRTFRDQLILAGMLAKKSTSTGMSIQIGGGDLHQGGSDVTTANSAAKLWAQISQFWTWVKDNNLDDKILLIVTHEFGRTPYNNSVRDMDVYNGSNNVSVKSYGRDHSLLTGMVFLNRNVPSGRVGGMGIGHTPLGSKGLNGIISPDIEGYKSVDVLGSLFMRLFSKKLAGDDRQLREYWNNFTNHIPLITG